MPSRDFKGDGGDPEPDGDVDQDDFAFMESCFTGPDVAVGTGTDCGKADLDRDDDVDAADYALFQICMSGPGQPAPAECISSAPPPGTFLLHGLAVEAIPDGPTLLYARARYYDTKHGRWLHRDPLGYVDGPNLYEAFGGNPMTYVDPTGLLSLAWHLRITGQALDETGFASGGAFRTGILVGSVYPDVPVQKVQDLVGSEMTPDQILSVCDSVQNHWLVTGYQGAKSKVKYYVVPGFLTDNAFVNDLRDWWDSSSIVEPMIEGAAKLSPEVKQMLWYRSHFGDLQYWHGMTSGGTAEEMFSLLRKRFELPFSGKNAPGSPPDGFDIGQVLHTIQDLYTPSHVERDGQGRIVRFQDYKAQSPTYHGEKDVLDLRNPADAALYRLLVNQTSLYLNSVKRVRSGTMSDDEFAALMAAKYLTSVPGGPAMGGTAPQFAPRPSVTGRLLDSTGGAARFAGSWIYDTVTGW